MRLLVLLLSLLCAPVWAHQWTPTYYAWRLSHVDSVLVATMMLWNSRKEVEYYEIQVLDAEMNPVRFVMSEKIIRVPYLKRKTVNVYISAIDKERAVYICSRSKILSDNDSKTVVSSRICSKTK